MDPGTGTLVTAMPRSTVPLLFVAALAAVMLSLRFAREAKAPDPATVASSRLPQPHPLEPFSVRDLNGNEVASASWAGQVVVVNFWSTWCLPCRREIPELVALQSRYRDRLTIVGIVDDQASDKTVREFMQSLGINYSVVRSTFDLTQKFPAVEVLPMTLVIDRGTRVISVRAGEFSVSELEREILGLMN